MFESITLYVRSSMCKCVVKNLTFGSCALASVYLITWHYLPQMPSGFFYSQCGESMGEIYIFSLQILANLCRANVSVQAFMKGLVCKSDEFLLHVYSSKIMCTSTYIISQSTMSACSSWYIICRDGHKKNGFTLKVHK